MTAAERKAVSCLCSNFHETSFANVKKKFQGGVRPTNTLGHTIHSSNDIRSRRNGSSTKASPPVAALVTTSVRGHNLDQQRILKGDSDIQRRPGPVKRRKLTHQPHDGISTSTVTSVGSPFDTLSPQDITFIGLRISIPRASIRARSRYFQYSATPQSIHFIERTSRR